MSWLHLRLSALNDSVSRLFANPVTAFLHIVSVGVSLSIPMGVYILVDGADQFSRKINASTDLNIFLQIDASTEDVERISNRLRETSQGEVTFIHRDKGLKNLASDSELEKLISNLNTNPIPHLLIFAPRNNQKDNITALAREVASWASVDEVRFDAKWAGQLEAIIKLIKLITGVLLILVGLGVMVTIFTTIRLQILSRKEEIEVARLVGATARFVRRPFLYFGFIQGLLGGLCATVLIVVGLKFGLKHVRAPLESVGFNLTEPSIAALLSPVFLSIGLSLLGAWISSNNHLREIDR